MSFSIPINRVLIAVILMAIANIILAFNDVWLRRIADNVGLYEVLWWRSVGFLLLVTILRYPGQWWCSLRAGPFLILAARGCLPILASYLLIGAMGKIPVAEAHGLFYVAPLLTVLLAGPLLNEKIGFWRFACVCIGMVGALLIIRPDVYHLGVGQALALGAAAAIAFYQIMSRLERVRSDPSTALFVMAIVAVVISGLIVLLSGDLRKSSDNETSNMVFLLWPIVGATVLYFVGHYIYILAYRYAEASILAPLVYCQLLGSIVGAQVFFGQWPQPHVGFGMTLIVVAGLLPLIVSWIARKKRYSKSFYQLNDHVAAIRKSDT